VLDWPTGGYWNDASATPLRNLYWLDAEAHASARATPSR
jgi:hypothetical protein